MNRAHPAMMPVLPHVGPVPEGVWDRVRPLLRRVLPRTGGTHDADDVRAGIADGALQLWLPPEPANSLIITEMVRYPKLMALNYWLVAGRFDEVRAMEPAVNAWAASMGCTRVQGAGRDGWARRTPGWSRIGSVYERAL